jgi:transposase
MLLEHAPGFAIQKGGNPGIDAIAAGAAHLRWLAEVVCPTPAPQIVFQEYVRAVNEHTERLERLEQALKEHVQSWRLNPVVEALQALRGVQCTVAVTLVAELGDRTRFDHPTEAARIR